MTTTQAATAAPTFDDLWVPEHVPVNPIDIGEEINRINWLIANTIDLEPQHWAGYITNFRSWAGGKGANAPVGDYSDYVNQRIMDAAAHGVTIPNPVIARIRQAMDAWVIVAAGISYATTTAYATADDRGDDDQPHMQVRWQAAGPNFWAGLSGVATTAPYEDGPRPVVYGHHGLMVAMTNTGLVALDGDEVANMLAALTPPTPAAGGWPTPHIGEGTAVHVNTWMDQHA